MDYHNALYHLKVYVNMVSILHSANILIFYYTMLNVQCTYTCMRCGTCCLADMVAFLAYVSDGDIMRWEREGRDDIIRIIQREEAVWAGDHLVSSRDGHYIHGCPFLKQEGAHFTCTIYETRPGVCRNYQPGSSEICPLFKK